MSADGTYGPAPSVSSIKGSNGIVVNQRPDGGVEIALDEQARGRLMIGHNQTWNEIAFSFDAYAFVVRDLGGSVVLRLFDHEGMHDTHLDLKSVAFIVEFLQGVLATDAAKMMDKKETP